MSTKEEEVEAKVVTTTDEKSQEKEVDKDDEVPQTFPQRVSSLSLVPRFSKVSSHYLAFFLSSCLSANNSQLMEILSDENNIDIITWLPHGKGFTIVDKKRFAEEVLPKNFKKSKFTSFTRKLNRWSFVRVTRGPETGGK